MKTHFSFGLFEHLVVGLFFKGLFQLTLSKKVRHVSLIIYDLIF